MLSCNLYLKVFNILMFESLQYYVFYVLFVSFIMITNVRDFYTLFRAATNNHFSIDYSDN